MHRLTILRWLLLSVTVMALAATAPARAVDPDELLSADQAFLISAKPVAPDRIQVTWRIADGYYMYQSKFRLTTDSPGITLGAPEMPPAKRKHDPFFGDIEIYRGLTTLEVPIKRSAGAAETLTLKTRSQGCADVGVCYPPHSQTVLVALTGTADIPPPVTARAVEEMEQVIANRSGNLVQTATPAADKPAGNLLAELAGATQELGQSLGLEDDDGILPVEQAFQFETEVKDGNTLLLRWRIADGTYLYNDKMQVLLRGDDVRLGSLDWPKPKIKQDTIKPDGTIGDVPVYLGNLEIPAPLIRTASGETTAELTIGYQGCADIGICYPPVRKVLEIVLPPVAAATNPPEAASAPAAEQPQSPSTAAGSAPVAEQDRIVDVLRDANVWTIIGAFFLIGIGLAFTPCIFPMVPILSGIITGQGTKITTRKAFVLSLTYVLSMAVVYAALGTIVGAVGAELNLQAQAQSPWVLVPFALLFAALALSMFGFYELQLPSALQTRLSEYSNRQEGGTLIGVGIMGALSALIVGPCTGPAIAGVMIFIWTSGEVALGGLALLMMGLGMGVPLLAFGTGAGKFLPHAGAWMDSVKGVFGVLMLGIAILLLERLTPTYLPLSVPMFLWGMLLMVSAIYMGALKNLPIEASGWTKLWKGLGLVLLVYGATFIIGVAAGGKDSLQPLRGIMVGGGAESAHLSFKRIKTIDDLNAELAAAKTAGRPVMLDFYADWCVYCKQMERETFTDAAVHEALSAHVLLQADVTVNDAADQALQKHVGIPAPPAILFWDAAGTERHAQRLLGFMGPVEFASHVEAATR